MNPRKRARRLHSLALWLLLCLWMAIWLGGCRGAETAEGPVVLYTSVPADIVSEIEVAFETAYPELDLVIYRAYTSEILLRLEEDVAAGRHNADVIWIADFSVVEDLRAAGRLFHYVPPEADALLDMLRDEEGTYYASRLLNMVIVYNTDAVDTPPTTYRDLLSPVYYRRVGHATPDSGAFFYFFAVLLRDTEYGEPFFRDLAANEPSLQDNTETTARVAAGELDIGIAIDFTVRRLLRENPDAPVDFVYPAEGVVMVPSPIAILEGAPNLEGAKLFERYVLSVAGQTLLRDIAGVVPVRLDVTPPEGIDSITQLQVIPADTAWMQAHRDEIASIFAAIYGEE